MDRIELTRLILIGTGAGYVLSTVGYITYATLIRKHLMGIIANALLLLTFLLHTLFLLMRIQDYYTQERGFVTPAASLFEALSYASWMAALIYIVGEVLIRNRTFGAVVLFIPTVLFNYGLLGYTVNKYLADLPVRAIDPAGIEPRPLMPALQSIWMTLHINTMMISYAALFTGGALALLYLIKYLDDKGISPERLLSKWVVAGFGVWYLTKVYFHFALPRYDLSVRFKGAEVSTPTILGVELLLTAGKALVGVAIIYLVAKIGRAISQSVSQETIDALSYRFIAFGYPLLTLGIFLGAVWANESWGRFWGWDPKETWAFITWVFYTAYLHNRLVLGWKGLRSGLLAIFGVFIVMITFVGVNYVTAWFETPGLHNYMPGNF